VILYCLMTKRSGLGDSTELSRMGLSQLDWYVMREEPNNIMNTMMNTSIPTMNNVTYH
jgi:hypothetical protein